MTDVLDQITRDLRRAESVLHAHRTSPLRRSVAFRLVRLRRASPRRLGVAGAAALVVATGGGIAVGAALGGSVVPESQYYYHGQRAIPEAAPTPDQTAELGILRRPRTTGDVLPAGVAAVAAANYGVGGYGANLDLSQLAQDAGGAAAWVIPANEGFVCLDVAGVATNTFPPVGLACVPDTAIDQGALWVADSAGPLAGSTRQWLLAGVVPDGVSAVTITLTAGATLSVPVVNNVYLVTLESTGYESGYADLGDSPPPGSSSPTLAVTFTLAGSRVTEPVGPQGVVFVAPSSP